MELSSNLQLRFGTANITVSIRWQTLVSYKHQKIASRELPKDWKWTVWYLTLGLRTWLGHRYSVYSKMGAVCGEFGMDIDPKDRRKQRQRKNSGKMWCLIWQERSRREWIWLIQELIGEDNPWKQEEGKMGKTTRWNWDKFPHFAFHCFWWIEWSHYRTMKYKPLLSDGSTWLVSGLEGFFLLPCQDTQKDGFADVRTSWELWKDLPEKRERGNFAFLVDFNGCICYQYSCSYEWGNLVSFHLVFVLPM